MEFHQAPLALAHTGSLIVPARLPPLFLAPLLPRAPTAFSRRRRRRRHFFHPEETPDSPFSAFLCSLRQGTMSCETCKPERVALSCTALCFAFLIHPGEPTSPDPRDRGQKTFSTFFSPLPAIPSVYNVLPQLEIIYLRNFSRTRVCAFSSTPLSIVLLSRPIRDLAVVSRLDPGPGACVRQTSILPLSSWPRAARFYAKEARTSRLIVSNSCSARRVVYKTGGEIRKGRDTSA